MRLLHSLKGVILFLNCIVLSTLSVSGQAGISETFCREYQSLVKFMGYFHVEGEVLTELEMESLMLNATVALDPQGLIWLAEDTILFNRLPSVLFDAQKEGNCRFFEQLVHRYEKRLVGALHTFESLPSPVYAAKDTLILYGDDKRNGWAVNSNALENRWNRYLKDQILRQAYQDTDSTDVIQPENFKDFASIYEEIARQKGICKIQKIQGYEGGIANYVSEIFLKEMTHLYDPHSTYFPISEKRNFENALSKDSYTFGFELGRNREGQIEISRLAPGGPAWKSQEINEGDIVTAIRMSTGKALDLICSSVSDLTTEIETTNSRNLTIEIQKASGLKKSVTLIKERMSVEENTLDSFILEGEQKIGYIYLPGFYTQFEDGNALGCANDVAKELLLLQIEDIEGLILDLRYNGGGSMKEAIDLAGLFIDEGPIAMTNDREEGTKILKDMNRGTTYDGPLMVMVNGMSASASELFAASIQDYHRGLVVGTTTYGKATGQVILPLHPSRPKDGAAVKVTNFKFYRVTGQSHQMEGVIPDIEIPDPWRELITLESEQPSAIERDALDKQLNYEVLREPPVANLNQASQKRVAANPFFQIQKQSTEAVHEILEEGKVVILQPDGYGETLGEIRETFDQIYEPETGKERQFQVLNNRSMTTLVQLSENLKLRNEQVKGKLTNDLQLKEAFAIMTDWLNMP